MKRILIVDDSNLILSQLEDSLASSGYEVVARANSGEEAVLRAREARPDVILMDIVMPGEMDGIRAAQIIGRELHIPVVFLTSHDEETVIERVKDAGADGYILKPFKSAELKATIEIALQKKRFVEEARDLYKEVVENTSDFIYVLDGGGDIKFLNRTACESLGEPLDRLVGMNFKDLATPESYEHTVRLFMRRLKGEEIGAYEIQLYDKDKSVRTIETRERLVWDKGRVVEVHGIARDVTERKKADEAFRKSEERYRIITQHMRDTVWVLDRNLKPVFISPSVERARGYTFEELKALPLEKNLTSESYETMVKAVLDMLSQEKVGGGETRLPETVSLEWFRKDGTTYWSEVSLSLISDEKGDPVEILGVGRDITERRRNEEALRQSEERYRALFENAAFGIFHSHPDGRFLRVNSALARILGYDSPEEVISSVRDFKKDLYANPEDRVKAIEEMAQQKGWGFFEADWRRKDGAVITARVHIRLVFDSTEAFQYVEGFLQDITEEKRAREQILYLKEFNETIINSMVDSIDIIDKDYTIIFQNSTAKKRFGEGVGKKCHEFYHGIVAPCEYCMAPEAVTKKRCLSREIRLEDGTYLEVHSSPIKMPDGDSCSMEIMRDITVRKKAESALRDSEQRYRLLAENANDIIFTADMNLHFTYISPSVTRIRGFTVEEALAQTAAEALTPGSLIVALDVLGEELKIEAELPKDLTRTRTLEMEETCKDGSTIWTETTFSSLRDERGGLTGILGITRDISERRKAEEALRESEEKFRNMFETSRDFLYIASLDGKILEYNRSGRDFFGYSDEEILNLNLRDLYAYPEEREKIVKKVMSEGSVENYELRLKKKDGTPVDVLLTVVARRDGDGNVIGLQGTVKDVTQMKRLELQLVQSEKLSGLGTMISGVAHELNNPLTAIMGNAELLLRDSTIPRNIVNALEVIYKESDRAARIVSGLLTFAREHRSERRTININDIILESYKLREYHLKTSNIEVKLSLSPGIPLTHTDPYLLQQVYTNIINNARDALIEKGGGALTIRTYDRDNVLFTEFEDDGPGIKKENLKRIFDPFFTTKDVGKGTGLGLSMAFGIINEQGGTIDVESELGKGAKFTVTIPIVRSQEMENEESTLPGTGQAGKRILVIDDEEYLRNLLSRVLCDSGSSVETASSGAEAVKLIEKEKFDAIVTDIKMPGMGGMELYAYIINKHPSIAKRMLFITGDTLSEETQTFLEVTGNKFIAKPFKIDEFLRILNQVLGQ